jgi:hypothetical protein
MVAAFAVLFLSSAPVSGRFDGGRVLEAVVENVEAWEHAYADIEVLLHDKYRHFWHLEELERVKAGAEPRKRRYVPYASWSRTIHFVSQGALFRVESKRDALMVTGERRLLHRVRAFDGSTTRLCDQGRIGNIIRGRAEGLVVRPHRLLLLRLWDEAPLSTVLRGGKPDPRLRLDEDLYFDVEYMGQQTHRGLRCHVVGVSLKIEGTNTALTKHVFWLPEERNYIPVRKSAYRYRWSEDLPGDEAEVVEWMEIGPGLWFPKKAYLEHYNPFVLKRQKTQKLMWKEDLEVKKVSLDPQYPLSYFQDVPFPEGIPVYEIVDGKIVSSRVQGEAGGQQPAADELGIQSGSGRALLALVSLLALGAMFVGAWVWSRTRRRAQNDSP